MKLAVFAAALVILFAAAAHHNNRQKQADWPGKPPKARNDAKPGLPTLVELGAVEVSEPCKMMARVLEELRQECAGQLAVVYVDVWKEPDAGRAYRIRMIPTQVLFNAAGQEIYRHEGWWPKADILAAWKELGVDLQKK